MKKYTVFTVSAVAAMMLISGCSGTVDEFQGTNEAPISNGSAVTPYTYEASNDETGGEHRYSAGATRLSVSDGRLGINRRSREGSSSMGDSGWTILVYLCGTDLESDYQAASIDISEAISAQYSNDVHIVYQTGGTRQWNCGFSNSSIQRFVNVEGDIELVDELP